MVTKTKRKPKAGELDPTDEHAGDEDQGDDDGDEHDEHAGDEEAIEAIVRRVLSEVLGDDTDGGDDADRGGSGAGDGPRTAADMERAAFDGVKAAMAQLRKDGESEDRLRRIEEKVSKGITEEAPKVYRRLTRLLWGSDD